MLFKPYQIAAAAIAVQAAKQLVIGPLLAAAAWSGDSCCKLISDMRAICTSGWPHGRVHTCARLSAQPRTAVARVSASLDSVATLLGGDARVACASASSNRYLHARVSQHDEHWWRRPKTNGPTGCVAKKVCVEFAVPLQGRTKQARRSSPESADMSLLDCGKVLSSRSGNVSQRRSEGIGQSL